MGDDRSEIVKVWELYSLLLALEAKGDCSLKAFEGSHQPLRWIYVGARPEAWCVEARMKTESRAAVGEKQGIKLAGIDGLDVVGKEQRHI